MHKTLILLAGYPGTGKSYLMDQIKKVYSEFTIISPDEFKEKMWDTYGFRNMEEKNQCIEKAWKAYYQEIEQHMIDGYCMLSDYPFSEKQKETLNSLSLKYDYQVVTIRLLADLDVLYRRQRERDLDSSRHLGHIVGNYHKGMVLKNREEQPCMVSYEEFIHRCKSRGYDTFELGTLLKEIDVSDFSKVDYLDLFIALKEL